MRARDYRILQDQSLGSSPTESEATCVEEIDWAYLIRVAERSSFCIQQILERGISC